MTTRSYLSIGDVLTLLRQEFPDVTISKIRFLESQGLVNPERTPSGYRKFYEHDVERLRWVLRQQREHFLPLKVIKDRLDDGHAEAAEDPAGAVDAVVDDSAGPAEPEAEAAEAEAADAAPEGPVASPSGVKGRPRKVGREGPTEHAGQERPAGQPRDRKPEPVLVGHRASSESGLQTGPATSGGTADRPLTLVDDGATLPGIETADRSRAAGQAPTPAPMSGTGPSGPSAAAGSPAAHLVGPVDRTPALGLAEGSGAGGNGPASGSAAPAAGPLTSGAPSGRSASHPSAVSTARGVAATGAPSAGGGPATDATPTPKAAPSAEADPPARAPRRQRAAASAEPAGADPGAAMADGATLSAEELAEAAGLEVSVVRDLEEYGLLCPTTVAGVEHFDRDALAVAVVAGRFTRFGIEPRHLRLYKNAADREAGFVEQIVLPLVRQRNPEARTRAHETAEELAHLGQELRRSLLRAALGGLLDG